MELGSVQSRAADPQRRAVVQRRPSVRISRNRRAGHRDPRTAEIIEVHSGRCVDTLDWRDGRWCSRDDRGRDDHPEYEDWDE